jgi:hypothetical protein
MADAQLYERAATCYYQARLVSDAVRCYRLAGAYRRAADLNVSLGEFREAAADYEQSGLPELAAWLLVHRAADPAAARAIIAKLGDEHAVPLRNRLVLARCAIAEDALPTVVLPVLSDTCASLADPATTYDRFTEEWAVIVAGIVQRYDQVALIFAAAVRGGRYGAVRRWAAWTEQTLGTELTVAETGR